MRRSILQLNLVLGVIIVLFLTIYVMVQVFIGNAEIWDATKFCCKAWLALPAFYVVGRLSLWFREQLDKM